MMATNDDRDVFVDECTENNIENDLPHADSEGEVNEVVDAVLDNGLDDYQSGDDSGCNLDETDDEAANEACYRYERNSGGFEFTADGENIVLKPGQLFKDVDEFRKVVKVYAIKNAFRLERVKNEKSRVTLRCATTGCTWRLQASPNWNKGNFQIKTYCSEHTCVRNTENYEATSTWIAISFLHLFRANTQLPIDVIASELFRRYRITCCNQRLYRTRNKALELLGQDHKVSYTKLFRYMHAILASNPGSTVSLDEDWLGGGVDPYFRRFFVFFDASRRGFFGGCRQFIGIDGCFLKGPYKGVLLSAVSVDANYGIYPLAVCVVENENTESWVYFLEKLYEQIGCNYGEGLCFISDRQKGILNALDKVFPHALKRYCCRHIYANFKEKFLGVLLKKPFWQACRIANVSYFRRHMAELNEISPAGHDWLMQIPVVCWAKHCFPAHTKSNHVTNNMSESFNNWIKNYRGMPILRMLEEIRRKLMTLIHTRQQEVLAWQDKLPPVVRRRVTREKEAARSLTVIFGHNQTFEVMEDVSKRTVVDLLGKHCDCNEWDISGLPCKHAICCIDAMRFNVNDFVHPLLKKISFQNTYSHQLYPMPDESKWPLLLHNNLQPPIISRCAGRPQTKRKKELGEAKSFKRSSSVKCSRCGQWGHNKRGCKAPIQCLKLKKAELKRNSAKGKGRCSGSKYADDGIASNAASTENMVSTQSSVIGHGFGIN
ncbi:SWIM-type domain-containing protein [Citrus sinensis]|nr:SWIM-type domain-containing protein [Citrus sinensis]